MVGVRRWIVLAAATVAGITLVVDASDLTKLGSGLAVLIAAVTLSGPIRDLPVDLALPAVIIAAVSRWLFPESAPVNAVVAVLAAIAILVVLAGATRPTVTASGVALAATAVLQSTIVEAPGMRWLGVAGCVIVVLSAHRPTPEPMGSGLVGALAADLVALLLGLATIGAMAYIDDVSRLVLPPFTVTVLALGGLVARRRRFRDLLAVESLRRGVATAEDARVAVGTDGRILMASVAASTRLGLEVDVDLTEPLEQASVDVLHAALGQTRIEGGSQSVGLRLLVDDLGWREVQATVSFLGQMTNSWIVALDDQTEVVLENRRRDIEVGRLRDAVKTDVLTGVMNRVGIVHAIDRRLQQENVSVIFIDLDGFKDVNDTYGHDAGDAVLKAVAQRISRAMGPDWNLGRLGGDEFVIEGPEGGLSMQDVGELGDLVREPISHGDSVVSVDVSMGVATGRLGADPDDVIRAADRAMYVDKQRGHFGPAGPSTPAEMDIPIVGPRRLSKLFERSAVN